MPSPGSKGNTVFWRILRSSCEDASIHLCEEHEVRGVARESKFFKTKVLKELYPENHLQK